METTKFKTAPGIEMTESELRNSVAQLSREAMYLFRSGNVADAVMTQRNAIRLQAELLRRLETSFSEAEAKLTGY